MRKKIADVLREEAENRGRKKGKRLGEVLGLRRALLLLLRERFGDLPPDTEATITKTGEGKRLEEWLTRSADAQSLEDVGIVRQSTADEFLDEHERQAARWISRVMLRLILKAQFGSVPPPIAEAIEATESIEQLQEWVDAANSVSSLEEMVRVVKRAARSRRFPGPHRKPAKPRRRRS